MAATILTLVPSFTSQGQFDEKVALVSFGDGYEQRAPIGINAKRLSFKLAYQGVTTAKAAQVLAFFRNLGGHQAFLWTPPAPWDGDGQLQFVARLPLRHTWNAYDSESVEIDIEQDFNPIP